MPSRRKYECIATATFSMDSRVLLKARRAAVTRKVSLSSVVNDALADWIARKEPKADVDLPFPGGIPVAPRKTADPAGAELDA